jgi:predicted metalloprotease
MRTDGPGSDNVEDRRGMPGGGGGGFGGRRVVGGGIGIVLVAVVAMFFGVDPRLVIGVMEGVQSPGTQAPMQAPGSSAPIGKVGTPNDEMGRFVAVVLKDTETTWNQLFAARRLDYREPALVLFTQSTPTACGTGQSAMGPFYCPRDQKVYIDLAFYATLRTRLGAPGDFAQAYVIAHEVGHHVQNQLGIMRKLDELRPRLSEAENNALSVRVELQADCFAGVWAHHANNRRLVEAGDIEEALNAAAAIGDDTLQRRSQGTIVPETFTHGTAQQRARWFRVGLVEGRIEACNTFDARTL